VPLPEKRLAVRRCKAALPLPSHLVECGPGDGIANHFCCTYHLPSSPTAQRTPHTSLLSITRAALLCSTIHTRPSPAGVSRRLYSYSNPRRVRRCGVEVDRRPCLSVSLVILASSRPHLSRLNLGLIIGLGRTVAETSGTTERASTKRPQKGIFKLKPGGSVPHWY
jgi:hypothetical protein